MWFDLVCVPSAHMDMLLRSLMFYQVDRKVQKLTFAFWLLTQTLLVIGSVGESVCNPAASAAPASPERGLARNAESQAPARSCWTGIHILTSAPHGSLDSKGGATPSSVHAPRVPESTPARCPRESGREEAGRSVGHRGRRAGGHRLS